MSPTSCFFPWTESDIIWYGISLWSVGVSCPGCAPLPTSSAPSANCLVGWCEEKILTLCKHCSTKTSLCYQHYFQHKSKNQPQNLTLFQPKPVQLSVHFSNALVLHERSSETRCMYICGCVYSYVLYTHTYVDVQQIFKYVNTSTFIKISTLLFC